MRSFVKIRMSILFDPKCPNLGTWALNLNSKSWKEIPDLPNFGILGCFASFWLVSGRFGWFQLALAGFNSF